jgi:hypothetical protein
MKHAALILALGCLLISCQCGGTAGSISTGPPGGGPPGGGEGDTCAGVAIPQIPADVTAQLSQVAPGVTVTQVTSLPVNGGSWNTYDDVLAYSPMANVMLYNFGANPAAIASANQDGTSSQLISGSPQGIEVQVTIDGKFAYYEGQNPDGTADIYAVSLSPSGKCTPIRLSQLNMTPIPPATQLIISTSSIDPTTNHNVIAFSEGTILHRVLDDGTELPDIALGDPENVNVFHRMRLNPVFSNMLWYKRDDPAPNPDGVAEPEIWVVNLQSPGTVYSVTGTVPADHNSWSNNGMNIGYITNGLWYVANVLNSAGSFIQNNGSFATTEIGPSNGSFSVDFCDLSPDGSVYVCAESYQAVYLMSLDGTQTKFLASPDSSPTGAIYNGIPKPRFLDMQHIIFSSDRTGIPQVYVISGFTTTFP